MPLPPRVTVMIERQLNDIELRHDPERVRVASVLLVWSSCRLVFLSPYRPTHYPPFVPLLVPSHSCPSRVLYPVLFAFFSHSFHILFAFFSPSFRKCPPCRLLLRRLFCPTYCPTFPLSRFLLTVCSHLYPQFYLSRCPSQVVGLSTHLSCGTMTFDSGSVVILTFPLHH